MMLIYCIQSFFSNKASKKEEEEKEMNSFDVYYMGCEDGTWSEGAREREREMEPSLYRKEKPIRTSESSFLFNVNNTPVGDAVARSLIIKDVSCIYTFYSKQTVGSHAREQTTDISKYYSRVMKEGKRDLLNVKVSSSVGKVLGRFKL